MESAMRILLILMTTLLWSCGNSSDDSGSEESQPATPGVLSVSAYYYSEPTPANDLELLQRYVAALQLVQEAGAKGQFQSYRWSQLELTVGSYDAQSLADFSNTMDSAEQNQLTQLVGLQVINTVTREVPAGLENTAWDDPAMITALEDLLDQLIPAMQGRVSYLSIGNEVDVYFANGRLSELNAYRDLVSTLQSYLSTRLPQVKVGITITAGGWLGPQVQNWLD